MSRILTLAGKRWLAGMNWRTYDKPPARALVRAEARALGANVFVQRSGTIRTVMGVEPRYDGIDSGVIAYPVVPVTAL